jgi:hypothetical protein
VADRYWVGGSGNWNGTNTTNWSTSSGGVGGASVPTSSDNVIFNSASNATAYTVTLATAAANCLDLTVAGPASGNVTFAGSVALNVAGSMTLPASGMTRTYTGGITFNTTSSGKTVTTNGVSLAGAITFDGVGGAWTLGGALTTTGAVTLTNGSVALSSYTLTCSSFSSNNSNTRTLDFGTGKIVGTATISWTCNTLTNMTVSGSRTVESSSATSSSASHGTAAGGAEANAIDYKSVATTTAAISGHFRVLDLSGCTATLGNGSRTSYGNITLGASTVVSQSVAWTLAGSSGTLTFTSAGVTVDAPITQNSAGATWQLPANLTMGSTRTYTLTAGTLDLNGKTLTCATFASNNSNARTLAFGVGAISVNTNFTATTATNLTVTYSAGAKVSMTSASAKTFNGGGASWPKLENAGTGSLVIGAASNTFADITTTVTPATITFPNGQTQTFAAFSLNGTALNLCTINSDSAGVQATISKASGTVTVTYCTIQDSAATGGQRGTPTTGPAPARAITPAGTSPL